MAKKLREKSGKDHGKFEGLNLAAVIERQAEVEAGMSLMDLLRWGSLELLKQATMAEVTEYLGYGPYERVPAAQKAQGERNGFRETTIDTPQGTVSYNLYEAPEKLYMGRVDIHRRCAHNSKLSTAEGRRAPVLNWCSPSYTGVSCGWWKRLTIPKDPNN